MPFMKVGSGNVCLFFSEFNILMRLANTVYFIKVKRYFIIELISLTLLKFVREMRVICSSAMDVLYLQEMGWGERLGEGADQHRMFVNVKERGRVGIFDFFTDIINKWLLTCQLHVT